MSEGELPHYESLVEAIRDILHETTATKLAFRDEGLFDSAFNRPRNLIAYSDASPTAEALAASLAFGMATNHPLIDGNKRAGAISLIITLFLNGRRLDVSQQELIRMFLAVASGQAGEEELRQWAQENSVEDERFT